MTTRPSCMLRFGAVLILCAAVGSGPTHAAGWNQLPDDVIAAIHFDMESLVESELYKSLVEEYGSRLRNPGAKYLEFVEATGFDVERDLATVTIGVGEPRDGGDGALYAIVRGKFDRDKIDAYARESDKVLTGTHGKLTTYAPLSLDLDGPPPVAAWVDAKTMIVASEPDFPRLVESVKGKGLSAKNSELGRLLSDAEGQFYVAMRIPDVATASGDQAAPTRGLATVFSQLQNPAAGPMRSLETILLTLNARAGLDLAIRASTDSAENGRLVYEMLNGYLMMGRSMAAQNPQAADILNHLELEQAGSSVAISVSMTGDDVRAALTRSRATTGGD